MKERILFRVIWYESDKSQKNLHNALLCKEK
jgi:hypothetical protein